VAIDPRQAEQRYTPPDIRLEEILVDEKPHDLSSVATSNLPAHASTGTLNIPPGQRRLEFHFTGFYFAAPDQLRFRYKLDGLDHDWMEAGAQRSAPYSYVPHGHYSFRVSAHNGDGVWSEVPATLNLAIQPYYWETWAFRVASWLGGVVLVSGIVAAVLRHRLNFRMQALERQRAIERERTRIAQDMHDEIGSRLTKADMVARRVAADARNFSDSSDNVNVLCKTLDDITVTLDAVVWAVNPQHDTLDGLANYLTRFSQEFFAGTEISCELNIPADLPAVPLTAAVRHNLFLAFKEALNNAAKHALPSDVAVNVTLEDLRLTLEVRDNGVGFDPRLKRSGGRGLDIMQNRLSAIGGSCEVISGPGQGTRVRFELSLST
jgi:signal transduction histidine kinase